MPSRLSEKFITEQYEKSSSPYFLRWMGIDVPVELEEAYPVEQVIDTEHYMESGPCDSPEIVIFHPLRILHMKQNQIYRLPAIPLW